MLLSSVLLVHLLGKHLIEKTMNTFKRVRWSTILCLDFEEDLKLCLTVNQYNGCLLHFRIFKHGVATKQGVHLNRYILWQLIQKLDSPDDASNILLKESHFFFKASDKLNVFWMEDGKSVITGSFSALIARVNLRKGCLRIMMFTSFENNGDNKLLFGQNILEQLLIFLLEKDRKQWETLKMAKDLDGLVEGHATSEEFLSIVLSSIVPHHDANKPKIMDLFHKIGFSRENSDQLFSKKSLDQLIFGQIYSRIKGNEHRVMNPLYYFIRAYLFQNWFPNKLR